MTTENKTATELFERAADDTAMEMDKEHAGHEFFDEYSFKRGADWARTWVLQNEPVVRAMAEALDAMIKSAAEHKCGLRIADEALAAYRAACGEGDNWE